MRYDWETAGNQGLLRWLHDGKFRFGESLYDWLRGMPTVGQGSHGELIVN